MFSRSAIPNALFSRIVLPLWTALPRRRRASPVSVHARRLADSRGFSVRERGAFRFFFAERGPHAVERRPGDNGDCPAQVEDLITQFLVARHVFCDIAGFRDPLDSPFFPERRFIDVYFFNAKTLSGSNGRNFSSPVPSGDPVAPGAQSTCIHIRNTLNIRHNVTPAHEFFHHIQNGLTRLANAWFYEGTARWSQEALEPQYPIPIRRRGNTACSEPPPHSRDEDPFRPPDHTPEPEDKPRGYSLYLPPPRPEKSPQELLADPAACARLVTMSYDTAQLLWIPIANLCRDKIRLPPDDPLLGRRYSDGTPVLKTRALAGAGFMRALLEELGERENAIYRENNYANGWAANRSNPGNNRHILDVVRHTLARFCP